MIRFLTRLLRNVRAGEQKLMWHHAAITAAPDSIRLSSPAFANGAPIPRRHAGHGVGENVSPPLSWEGVPPETMELVLVIEDPDVPLPRPFVHGIVVGIPPRSRGIAENALAGTAAQLEGLLGRNSFGRTAYAGPRPLPGHGPHGYVFQLFALNRKLAFAHAPNRKEIVRALAGAVIARGRLDGMYERA